MQRIPIWLHLDSSLSVTKKWNTDNIISSEVSVDDKLLKGLKLTLDSTLAAQTGSKTGAVKAAFKKDHVNIALDANLAKAPVVNGSAVVGYQGITIASLSSFFSFTTEYWRDGQYAVYTTPKLPRSARGWV